MLRPKRPPSPSWKSFLANQAGRILALDFFVVPTATFRLLNGFPAVSHDRRRVLDCRELNCRVPDCGVTAHPTSAWTAHQPTEAFPFESPPRFALHDRDGIYDDAFRERMTCPNPMSCRCCHADALDRGGRERSLDAA